MKTNKKILIGCGAVIGVIGLLLVLLIIVTPANGVKLPPDMTKTALEYLEKHKTLDNSGELRAYYDATYWIDGSESFILTTKCVIQQSNGKKYVININDIENIQYREEFMNNIFEVSDKSGKMIKIEIAAAHGAETFKNLLQKAWERVKIDHKKACFQNQKFLLGAIEMYNMDNETTPIKKVHEDTINKLIQGVYLRKPMACIDGGKYESTGDLSKDATSTIYCTKHGGYSE